MRRHERRTGSMIRHARLSVLWIGVRLDGDSVGWTDERQASCFCAQAPEFGQDFQRLVDGREPMDTVQLDHKPGIVLAPQSVFRRNDFA